MTTWDEAELQRHVIEGIQESSQLEYKAAGALDAKNPDAVEITKDISAMANSGGGVVIYGIKEFAKPKKHLPEKIDPIDLATFSKERLEHIINTIRPRLTEFKIIPVSLSSSVTDVCYVVEVAQGRTAHQSRDNRYYRRSNFESVPMEDYEIRLVMNRLTVPDATVQFGTRPTETMGRVRRYLLSPVIVNLSSQIIKNFKLIFTFPGEVIYGAEAINPRSHIVLGKTKDGDHQVSFQSTLMLFPEDERELSDEMGWEYSILDDTIHTIRTRHARGDKFLLTWKLYADNMPPKEGEVAIFDLHPY